MTYRDKRELLIYKLPMLIIDMAIHIVILYTLLNFLPDNQLTGVDNFYSGLIILLGMSFLVSSAIFKYKLFGIHTSISSMIIQILLQTFVTYFFFVAMLAMCYKAVPRHLIICCMLFSSMAIIIAHIIVIKSIKKGRTLGRFKRMVVFVGADETAMNLYHELSLNQGITGYRIMGFFTTSDKTSIPDSSKQLGFLEDVFPWLESNHPDELYCSLPPTTYEKEVNQIIKECNNRFVEFFFVPTMDGYPSRNLTSERIGNVTIIKLREEPMQNLLGKIYRRVMSFSISLLFLCTLYPFIFLFAALGIKLSGPGPVYFKQKRTGYNGKSFEIYKFRSMRINNEADTIQASENDLRKTRFGAFLRHTSIDEFPQFINVLKGDMDIVGPRPHMEYQTEVYKQLVGDYMLRHLAKPGITGWAQVNGYRGETKNPEQMAERVKHDIWYITHWTPLLDIEIVFRTIWQVLRGADKNAY